MKYSEQKNRCLVQPVHLEHDKCVTVRLCSDLNTLMQVPVRHEGHMRKSNLTWISQRLNQAAATMKVEPTLMYIIVKYCSSANDAL